MSRLVQGLFTVAFVAIAASKLYAVGTQAGSIFQSYDVVAAGQKWEVFEIESEDGFDAVSFLPAGQTREEAYETLTFTTYVEAQPTSAYDVQFTFDEVLGKAKNYNSYVIPRDNTTKARGMHYRSAGPNKLSQLFSLKSIGLDGGKTFVSVTYRVNAKSNSELENDPTEALKIMDRRVKRVSAQQIKDWFEISYEDAKQKLAEKKTASAQ